MPARFYLENRPNKTGECMIRVSVIMKNCRFLTSIGKGYTIHPNKWDVAKQCVKKGAKNSRDLSYSEINNRISLITSAFQDLESDVLKGRPITNNTLRKLWQTKFCKTPLEVVQQSKMNYYFENLFYSAFEKFMHEEGRVKNWRPVITKKFQKTKKQLKHFDPDLRFEDVTEEMLADFCTFLVDKYNLLNQTILKKMVDLRQFFRWCIDQGLITSSPMMKFKPKLPTTKNRIVFLEWDELMSVYNLEFTEDEPKYERIRDCFVFMCFTGLRYSDMYNLKKTDVRKNSIFVTTMKTNDALEIQLNNYSKAILDKYKDVEFPEDRALPVGNLTEMNIELKEICKKVDKLKKTHVKIVEFQGTKREETVYLKSDLIGSHCGRRTFISNAIMLGIAPDVVMKWTGHKHYSAMKPYIEIADKAKVDAMQLFNK